MKKLKFMLPIVAALVLSGCNLLSHKGSENSETLSSITENIESSPSTEQSEVTPEPVALQSIAFETTKCDLRMGETMILNVIYTPGNATNKKLIWTSSSKSYVTVDDNGVITAIKLGASSTITAKSEENNKIKATCKITPKAQLTGISFSKSTINISLNGSKVLLPIYEPKSNVYTSSVAWSSSNSSIVEVDQTGLITGHKLGTAEITAKDSKNTAVSASITVNVVENALDDYTILLYICGSDLESDNGLATSDLTEIASVNGQPDGVNIVIEAGGSKSWYSKYSSVINASKLSRFHLENKSYVSDGYLDYQSMGKASTLKDFLVWGLSEYPAEKTGLILWNHGGGLDGVCYDERASDDNLTDDEVITAVEGAFSTLNLTEKLEWIGYDACLMQCQEIAEFNSKYFNYMVGSQESESGYGWDYDKWVDNLYAGDSTPDILKEICKTFIDDNGGVSYYNGDQTLSYLDLSKMSAYKTAFEEFAASLKNKINNSNKSSFKSLFGSTKNFGGYGYDLYDMVHLLTNIKSSSTFNPGNELIDAVMSAYNDLLVYNCVQTANASNAHGLSLYYHYSYYGNMAIAKYSSFTNWNYICSTYGG